MTVVYTYSVKGRAEYMEECYEILDTLSCGICIVNIDEVYTIAYANDSFYSLTKNTVQSGKSEITNLKKVFSEEEFEKIYTVVQKKIISKQNSIKLEVKIHTENERFICLLMEGSLSPNMPEKIMWSFTDISLKKELERQMDMVEEEQCIIMQQTGSIFSKYEIATKTLRLPVIAANIFGLPCVCENIPYSITDKLFEDDSKETYINFYESMLEGKPCGNCLIRAKNVTGSFAWYAMKYTLTYDSDSKPYRAIISYEDITQLQEKEISYKKWRDYFESQQENCIAYYEYDLTQDTFIKLVGEVSAEIPPEIKNSFSEISGYAAEKFVILEDKDKYIEFFSRNKLIANYYTGEKEVRLEHRRRRRKDGSIFWALAIIDLVSDPYTDHLMASVLIKDIDEEKEAVLKLEQLSYTDALTGLRNRYTIIEEINTIIMESDEDACHALIMLDLDNFKCLNDSRGHQFGDRVLRETAEELSRGLRSVDLCGRMGGDEFMVLLKDVSQDSNLSDRIQAMQERLSKKYEETIKTSASFGVAMYPMDGKSFEELYEKADIALYQAKGNGRNQIMFYKY